MYIGIAIVQIHVCVCGCKPLLLLLIWKASDIIVNQIAIKVVRAVWKMVFYVRTKFKNVFRCIYFSEKDLDEIGENKMIFVNKFIEKGRVLIFNMDEKTIKQQINAI